MRRLLLVGLVALVGCENPMDDFVPCLLIGRSAIELTVRDSATQAPAVAGVVASWTRFSIPGVAVESDTIVVPSSVPSPSSALGLGRRSGFYEVHLAKGGYRPWTPGVIEVEQEPCGPATVELEAQLQPAR